MIPETTKEPTDAEVQRYMEDNNESYYASREILR